MGADLLRKCPRSEMFFIHIFFKQNAKCTKEVVVFRLTQLNTMNFYPSYNYKTAWATRCLGDFKFAFMWLTENTSGARVFSSPHEGKLEIP